MNKCCKDIWTDQVDGAARLISWADTQTKPSWDLAVPSSAQADLKLIQLKLAMEFHGN